MKNTTTQIRYTVYQMGGGVKEHELYFTSLSKAKSFMKEYYDSNVRMGVLLFNLSKDESNDGFKTFSSSRIQTRTTILNY